jgi:hypothetical protein
MELSLREGTLQNYGMKKKSIFILFLFSKIDDSKKMTKKHHDHRVSIDKKSE